MIKSELLLENSYDSLCLRYFYFLFMRDKFIYSLSSIQNNNWSIYVGLYQNKKSQSQQTAYKPCIPSNNLRYIY